MQSCALGRAAERNAGKKERVGSKWGWERGRKG